jgi:hypothetical protein
MAVGAPNIGPVSGLTGGLPEGLMDVIVTDLRIRREGDREIPMSHLLRDKGQRYTSVDQGRCMPVPQQMRIEFDPNFDAGPSQRLPDGHGEDGVAQNVDTSRQSVGNDDAVGCLSCDREPVTRTSDDCVAQASPMRSPPYIIKSPRVSCGDVMRKAERVFVGQVATARYALRNLDLIA